MLPVASCHSDYCLRTKAGRSNNMAHTQRIHHKATVLYEEERTYWRATELSLQRSELSQTVLCRRPHYVIT